MVSSMVRGERLLESAGIFNGLAKQLIIEWE
jgi:hypothetical protein